MKSLLNYFSYTFQPRPYHHCRGLRQCFFFFISFCPINFVEKFRIPLFPFALPGEFSNTVYILPTPLALVQHSCLDRKKQLQNNSCTHRTLISLECAVPHFRIYTKHKERQVNTDNHFEKKFINSWYVPVFPCFFFTKNNGLK